MLLVLVISCQAREMFVDTCGQVLLKTDTTHNSEASVGQLETQVVMGGTLCTVPGITSLLHESLCHSTSLIQSRMDSCTLRQSHTVSLDQQRLTETVAIGLTQLCQSLSVSYSSVGLQWRCIDAAGLHLYLAVCASLSFAVSGCLGQSGAVPASRVPTSLTETPPASIGLCTLY